MARIVKRKMKTIKKRLNPLDLDIERLKKIIMEEWICIFCLKVNSGNNKVCEYCKTEKENNKTIEKESNNTIELDNYMKVYFTG